MKFFTHLSKEAVSRIWLIGVLIAWGATAQSGATQGAPGTHSTTRGGSAEGVAPPSPDTGIDDRAVQTTPVADAAQTLVTGRLVMQSHRDGNWDIYRSDEAGGAVARLTSGSSNDIEPRWDRLATRIVFASDRSGSFQIYTMLSDGTGVTQVTSGFEAARRPTWSPDSSRIAFQGTQSGNTDLFTIRPDGSGLTRLTTESGYDGEADWSPDGTRIAFISRRTSGASDYFLYVMNADGTGVQALGTRPESGNPRWSPDQSRIAYDYLDSGLWQRLMLRNLTGYPDQQLFGPGNSATSDLRMNGWGSADRFFVTREAYNPRPPYEYLGSEVMMGNTVTGLYTSLPGPESQRADWSTVDRSAPIVQLLEVEQAQLIANPVFITLMAADVGQAGLNRFEVQLRPAGGQWATRAVNCNLITESPVIFLCSFNPTFLEIGSYDVRVRAIDADDNASPWSDEDESGQPLAIFWHWLYGVVRDSRDAPIVDAALTGAPMARDVMFSDVEGKYVAHALNTGAIITLTAEVDGYVMDDPRLHTRSDLRFPPSPVSNVRLDFWLTGADNILTDGDFEDQTAGQFWKVTGPAPATWSVDPSYPITDRSSQASIPVYAGNSALVLGWVDGRYRLPVGAHGTLPESAVWYTTSGWRGYGGSGVETSYYYECPRDELCQITIQPNSARHHPAAHTTLADGSSYFVIASEPPLSPETRLFKIDPQGQWSDVGAVPVGAGYLGRDCAVLVDSDGSVHFFWLDPATGSVDHLLRSPAGDWSAATLALSGVTRFQAALVAPGELAVFGVAGGARAAYWTEPTGWSVTQTVADGTTAFGDYLTLIADGQGTLTAAWLTGSATSIAAVRKPHGQSWTPASLLPVSWANGFAGLPDLLPGPEKTIAAINKPIGGQPWVGRIVQADGTWGPAQVILDSWRASPTVLENFDVKDIDWTHQRVLYLSYDYSGRTYANEIALGGSRVNTLTVTRALTVPVELWQPTLALNYVFTGDLAGDQLTLRLQPQSGAPVSQSLSVTQAWGHAWMDLSNWSGQMITVTIDLVDDGDAILSNAMIDNISVASYAVPGISSIDVGANQITITGRNFMPGAAIWIDQVALNTKRVNETVLIATLPPGSLCGRTSVWVVNPTGARARGVASFGATQIFLPLISRWPSVIRQIGFQWTP